MCLSGVARVHFLVVESSEPRRILFRWETKLPKNQAVNFRILVGVDLF